MKASLTAIGAWLILCSCVSIVPVKALAGPDEVFDQFLNQGGWSDTADDNIQGENLSSDLIKRIVMDYRAHPTDRDAQRNLGLLALAMGVAEWGVADPAGLPPDPAGKNWKSDTGPNSGKHLMSYGVGGVGISHADQGDLRDFISYVASTHVESSEHRAALLRLASPVYKKSGGVYDQLRRAGVCDARGPLKPPKQLDTDLKGEKFKHFNVSNNKNYCDTYANATLQACDWQIFRTWIRVALRTKAAQEWLIARWMKDYWFKSFVKVPDGDGKIEEALVNVRVRNSFPGVADAAIKGKASDTKGRIQRELAAYGAKSPRTLKRRCGIMLRPVVLYRHFAGEDQLKGIRCP